MNRGHKTLTPLLIVLILTAPLLAQSAKVELIGPSPAAVPSDLKAALEGKGYRVTLDDGWTADLWLAKDLKLANHDAPGALYPELNDSEFVGVISLTKSMSDFRGQAVPAGTYTLRYQLLPQDANHLGVSPNQTSCSRYRSLTTQSQMPSTHSTSWSASARKRLAHIRQ